MEDNVEKNSIPTSGYSMNDDAEWHETMAVWTKAMNQLGFFKKKLKGLPEKDLAQKAYDTSLLQEANKNDKKKK